MDSRLYARDSQIWSSINPFSYRSSHSMRRTLSRLSPRYVHLRKWASLLRSRACIRLYEAILVLNRVKDLRWEFLRKPYEMNRVKVHLNVFKTRAFSWYAEPFFLLKYYSILFSNTPNIIIRHFFATGTKIFLRSPVHSSKQCFVFQHLFQVRSNNYIKPAISIPESWRSLRIFDAFNRQFMNLSSVNPLIYDFG